MDGLITIVARVRSARAVLGWRIKKGEALQGLHICSTIEALMRPEARSILKNYLILLFLLCVLLTGIAEIISIATHPFFNPRIRRSDCRNPYSLPARNVTMLSFHPTEYRG
jgi:hypothetical protein